jgi:putative aldouronate transport system substrate-binding protein
MKYVKVFLCWALILFLPAGFVFAGGGGQKTSSPSSSDPGSLREKNLVTLDVVMMASAGKEGSHDVEDAINAYLLEKLNVKIKLTFITYGNYVQQTNLLLSAGQGVDILPVYMTPLFTVANNGQIIPLDDLLAKYGQGIVEQMGKDYVDCGRINNVLYGLPTGRDLAAAYGFEMRKDICDKYGIDYANITTLDQLHDALAIVHKNEPNLVCVVPSNGELVRNWGWDPLGDMVTPIGVLMNKGQSWEVVNLFETSFYKDFVTTMRKWYLEGLIMQDGISNSESVGVMMGAGRAFGGFMNLKPYFNVQETTNYGTEIVVSEIVPAFSVTSYVIMNAWSIASSSKHPEAAMKLLNMMYTDPTLVNLMIYGLEGTHYVKAGSASNGQSIIKYPPGVDGINTKYRPSGGWLWGNQFVGHVWEGNPPDYWDVTRKFNETALKSYAFGFSWDSSDVKNQITACTNVMGKYHKALMCGAVDPETTLPRFIQELKAAGIDDIIKDKQEKLNAWRKVTGK